MPLSSIGGSLLQYDISTPYHEKVCYWTETKGFKKEKREIEIEVCGTESVNTKISEEKVMVKFGQSNV